MRARLICDWIDYFCFGGKTQSAYSLLIGQADHDGVISIVYHSNTSDAYAVYQEHKTCLFKVGTTQSSLRYETLLSDEWNAGRKDRR